jgi:hypothetical protein
MLGSFRRIFDDVYSMRLWAGEMATVNPVVQYLFGTHAGSIFARLRSLKNASGIWSHITALRLFLERDSSIAIVTVKAKLLLLKERANNPP